MLCPQSMSAECSAFVHIQVLPKAPDINYGEYLYFQGKVKEPNIEAEPLDRRRLLQSLLM